MKRDDVKKVLAASVAYAFAENLQEILKSFPEELKTISVYSLALADALPSFIADIEKYGDTLEELKDDG